MSRAQSTKIDDPAQFFHGWGFVIEAHHYWTLGLELKTFITKKVPYQSWAYMTPRNYNFCQGHIFYNQADKNHFVQVGAEQGLFDIEVFEGHIKNQNTTTVGWITTVDGLAQWLLTGCRPVICRELDFSKSKSGLMAWQLINQNEEAMNTKTISGAEFKLHFAPLLATLKDDDEVFFGSGDLSFYRPKERGPVDGPRLVQIEFNEVYKVLADPDA